MCSSDLEIIPFVEDRRMAAGRRVIGTRLLHLKIDIDIAPWIAERRDAAAEDDDFLDVRVLLAGLHHLPDIPLFRREDAVDILVRLRKSFPHSHDPF